MKYLISLRLFFEIAVTFSDFLILLHTYSNCAFAKFHLHDEYNMNNVIDPEYTLKVNESLSKFLSDPLLQFNMS